MNALLLATINYDYDDKNDILGRLENIKKVIIQKRDSSRDFQSKLNQEEYTDYKQAKSVIKECNDHVLVQMEYQLSIKVNDYSVLKTDMLFCKKWDELGKNIQDLFRLTKKIEEKNYKKILGDVLILLTTNIVYYDVIIKKLEEIIKNSKSL